MTILGVSFDPPADNLKFSDDEHFPFELWTDDNKTLALTYGSVTSTRAGAAGRITVLLDTDGTWLLTYYPVNVVSGPGDTLADCEKLFGK